MDLDGWQTVALQTTTVTIAARDPVPAAPGSLGSFTVEAPKYMTATNYSSLMTLSQFNTLKTRVSSPTGGGTIMVRAGTNTKCSNASNPGQVTSVEGTNVSAAGNFGSEGTTHTRYFRTRIGRQTGAPRCLSAARANLRPERLPSAP